MHIYMDSNYFKYISLIVFIASIISGCGVPYEEYRRSKIMPPLDIPPDLGYPHINYENIRNQKFSLTYIEFEETANCPSLPSKY